MKRFLVQLLTIFMFFAASTAFSMASSPDGGEEAVIIAQESAPPTAVRVENAQQYLMREAKSKGWTKFSWDADKKRILKIQMAGGTISPFDDDFLAKRESLYVEAQLLAKASIIEAFVTEASAEIILSIPGNPIAKQVAEEQKQVKDLMAEQDRMLQEAKNEAQDLLSSVDAAQASELKGVSTTDRLYSLLDAAIKKLDESYSSGNVAEEKKARVEELILRLQRAREYEALVQAKNDELADKLAAIQGSIKKEQKSSIETLSEMPLFGATVLDQTESYDKLKEQYSIAVLMAWSPKLEMDARSILLGENERKPRPTKLTLESWLDKQNLGVMVGSRRYLPADGTINFIGISAVEYDPDDMGTYSDAQLEAELWAKQYAILSLMADVKSQKSAERLRRDVVGKDGKTQSDTLEYMSVAIRESVEGMQLRGLEIVRTEATVHPASGKSIIVAIASINSDLATQSSDLMKDTYATLKEIHKDQSYKKGEVEGMKAAAEEAKNDPAARAQGHADGSGAVNQEYASRQPAKKVEKKSQKANNPANFSQPATKNSAQSGSWGGSADVDEDF